MNSQELMLQTLTGNLKSSTGNMKLIVFAGGTGTRFWPLSRKKQPKHFIKMFKNKSTFQLAVERIEKTFHISNIYISTNQNYIPLVEEQLPHFPVDHIIGEPEKRNVGPAVGYCLVHLRKKGYRGPVAILWADHLVENVDNFIGVLKKGERIVRENPQRLVFIGEPPRYAEPNLGWIHVGKEVEKGQYEFKEWRYKPSLEESMQMFNSKEWYWNPGYFVVDLEFTLCLYRMFVPTIYQLLEDIDEALGTSKEKETIERVYPQMEPFHFDRIIEQIPSRNAVVLPANLGWSDPGTLYAFKEALVESGESNYTRGLTKEWRTTDSLIINEETGKLVATVGLDGMIVINTSEILLVVHKDNVQKVTKLVEELESDRRLEKFI